MCKQSILKYITVIAVFILSTNILAASVIEEEVIFQNGNLKLYGTLFKPETNGNFPAIVISHGSGLEHRKLRGMRSIAQQYANIGYITLLFDKRGVGDSDGEYIEMPDYVVAAGDLISAINFMKSRKEVNKSKIGLFGHSQAGWIMPLAAVACEDVSFMIVSCGGGVTPMRQTIHHNYTNSTIQQEKNHTKQQLNSLTTYLMKLKYYYGTKTKHGYDEMVKLYEQSKDKSWFKIIKYSYENGKPPTPDELNQLGHLYWKKLMYDPEITLVSLKIPVLVLLAEKDQHVPSMLVKQAWEDSFKKSGQLDNLKIVWLPNQTHALFEMINGEPRMRSEFSKPILEWLNMLK